MQGGGGRTYSRVPDEYVLVVRAREDMLILLIPFDLRAGTCGEQRVQRMCGRQERRVHLRRRRDLQAR
jgi:hypothetical protein